MPLRKYSFFLLLVILLPACIIPGCMVRQTMTHTVQVDQPYELDWLVGLSNYERRSSKMIIYREGQAKIAGDGQPEAIDRDRADLYIDYANRLDTCCMSAVFSIPQGTFVVNAPRGSAIITGANTNVLRIFNADARTANVLFENIDLIVPQDAPPQQTMEVIFYAFWVPMPSDIRLENFHPGPLLKSRDAVFLPWVLGTRGRYIINREDAPGGFNPLPDVLLPELAEPDFVDGADPNDNVAVDPIEPPEGAPDTDGDGVVDDQDMCPDQGSLGYGVSRNGCPLMPDSDGDGYWNGVDNCPNEGDQGDGVDDTGCPLVGDSDGDGVSDFYDYCPVDGNQGNGIDVNGCPIPGDSDGDGVSDYYDYCPNEGNQGSGVDVNGCPP
jgi:hypothetical protein